MLGAVSEMFCFCALSLAVRIERVLDSSLVECVVTLGYQVLISRRDLMVLGSSIPLRGKGIPCMTFIPMPYTALTALKAFTKSSAYAAVPRKHSKVKRHW